MHKKRVYIETIFKNSNTCNDDIMTIIQTIIILTITGILYAGALIQQDPNLMAPCTSKLLLSTGKGGRSRLVNRKS
jgi:hypothetical protein